MFQKLVMVAIQAALCHFLGYCMNQEECPDGVCTEAAKAVDSLGAEMPAADPTVTQAAFPQWNWSAIQEVADAITTLVAALQKLFNKTPTVG